jgi:hypothetical protein
MLFARIVLLVTVCSHHHLQCCGAITPTPSSPLTNTQDKADSPPHPSNADNDDAADDNADNNTAEDATDNNADVDADNNNLMQMTDNDTDAEQCRQWRTT